MVNHHEETIICLECLFFPNHLKSKSKLRTTGMEDVCVGDFSVSWGEEWFTF